MHSAPLRREVFRTLLLCIVRSLHDPMQPARLLCPWDFPGENTSPGDLSVPGIEPMFPVLPGGFFTTEPQEKSPPGLCLQPKSQELQLDLQGICLAFIIWELTSCLSIQRVHMWNRRLGILLLYN